MKVDVIQIVQNLVVAGLKIVAEELNSPPPPRLPPSLKELPPLPKSSIKAKPFKFTDIVLPQWTPPEPPAEASLLPSTLPAPMQLASTPDTVKRLRERLAEELYRMQLDLEDGAHIGGVPCDCLDGKHKLGLRATAKELLAMDSSPVPQQVLEWLETHEGELSPQAIHQYGPDHYKKLAGDMRELRKNLPS